MAQTVCVSVADRQRLTTILANRNRPQKHSARARIILHAAERMDMAEVAWLAGIGRPSVWCWHHCFAEACVDGFLRDRTRKPGKASTPESPPEKELSGISRLWCLSRV